MLAPENWRARGARERAIMEPLRRRAVDSSAFLSRFCAALRNDAFESSISGRRGLQIARSR
eukprot:9417532-Lingulodinium_polyedra.AAC.1